MKFQKDIKQAQSRVQDTVNNFDFDNVKKEARHLAHDVQDYAIHKAEDVKETLSDSVEKFIPLALAAYGGIKTFYGNQKDKYTDNSSSSNGATNALLFVAGAAIGATVGILLAPAKGSETRERISGETKKIVANAEEKGKKLASDAQDLISKNTETVKAKFQEGKEKFQEGKEKVSEKASELASNAKQKVNSNS